MPLGGITTEPPAGVPAPEPPQAGERDRAAPVSDGTGRQDAYTGAPAGGIESSERRRPGNRDGHQRARVQRMVVTARLPGRRGRRPRGPGASKSLEGESGKPRWPRARTNAKSKESKNADRKRGSPARRTPAPALRGRRVQAEHVLGYRPLDRPQVGEHVIEQIVDRAPAGGLDFFR